MGLLPALHTAHGQEVMSMDTWGPDRCNANLYCVVWRSGGTANFKWHRTTAESREDAIQAHVAIQLGGRVGYVVRYKDSMAIGLPDTFEARR